jgi:mRNA-degrading endonuclease RelE of RelBE toxin-antitoxin system
VVILTSFTTVQVDKKVLTILKKLKTHPRQSYNEVLENVLENKNSCAYDKYLHEIQKNKMKELWDNPDDEEWENV